MAKTVDEKITEAKEKIAQYENQMKLLIQQQREQERKARTKRLIERGAIVESLIEGADSLTNDQIKDVLTAALNSEPALEKLTAAQGKPNRAPAGEPQTAQGARA